MNTDAELWWGSIPGAQTIVRSISERMLQQTSLAVSATTGVHWPSILRMQVREQVQHRNANLLIENCDDSTMGDMSPGEWVLARYGSGIFRLPSISAEQTALSNGLLQDRIFWVFGVQSKARLKEWLDFATLLQKNRNRRCGCVVILLDSNLTVKGRMEQLDINQYISEYDLAFFAATMVASKALSFWEKKYLSNLAVCLSLGSPERCAELIQNGRDLLAQPEAVCGSNADLLNAVWRGQLQTVFAQIEETKRTLVLRLANHLKPILGTIDDYGNRLISLDHIELRHIVHHLHKRIAIPEDDEAVVRSLYEMRNMLAHHRYLSYPQMLELFQLFGG